MEQKENQERKKEEREEQTEQEGKQEKERKEQPGQNERKEEERERREARQAKQEEKRRRQEEKQREREEKRLIKLAAEQERVRGLCIYEKKYAASGLVCGIDEAGRGPLAGPVVAGAVILPAGCEILYINDSKKLSAKKREMLYSVILEQALAVGIGMASPQRIDEINILQATYEAMREAIQNLGKTPDILLNDAVTIPGVQIAQVPIVKGDAKSISIAAASIAAKVTRDRLMEEYDKVLPEYGFASHKGYGTKAHIAALKKHGPSPIHRSSFIQKFV